ncbi:MAG: hypothetical protein JWQ01_3376 [Massilia sp.]|nr:hypothetical protein [Massilia sp.]
MTPTPLSTKLRQYGWELALFGAMLCAMIYLLQRNLDLSPALFADEWYYSKSSRLAPLGEAIVPSYLYLWIFRSTNACGDQFLECARGLNALFYVAAAPFIYLVARRLAGRPLALAIAVTALLAPLNLYTAFFMPEAMYFFGFSLLSWVALNHTHWGSVRYGLATGALLGVMSLIKVHGLFLLPALLLFILFVRWSKAEHKGWIADSLIAVILAVLAMVSIRLGFGFMLAGEPALALFGNFYASSANNAVHRSAVTLLNPALINARGHLMAMAVLYVLPLAVLFHRLPWRPAQVKLGSGFGVLGIYLLLMMGTAFAMTIAYTASLAGPGSIEGVRLHMRYYSFAFPLLLVLAAAPLGQPADQTRPRFRLVVAALLAAVLMIALIKLPSYTLNMSDGPDIAVISLRYWPGQALVALNLVILALWVSRKKLALYLYLFIAVPVGLAAGAVGSSKYLAQLINPFPADKAGKFAHRYVPRAEHKFITVAGTNVAYLMRAQFHIDDNDVSVLELPDPRQPIKPYQIPPRNKWLLVVGDHALPKGIEAVVRTPDFALVKLPPFGRTIGSSDLVRPIGDALIERIDGLSVSESLGRWSTGKQVVIHFWDNLPKRFNLALKAQAFGPNADAPFILRAGSQEIEFRISTVPQEISFPVDNDGSLRTLTIEVPHPIAPKDVGPSVDVRTIGLAISEITIGELPAR